MLDKEKLENIKLKAYFNLGNISEVPKEDLIILWNKYPITLLLDINYFCVKLTDGIFYKMERVQKPYIKDDRIKIVFEGKEIEEEAYETYLIELENRLRGKVKGL